MNKLYAYTLAVLIILGLGIYGHNKIESLELSLSKANTSIAALSNKQRLMEADITEARNYYSKVTQGQEDLNTRFNQLDKSLGRLSIIVAKPSLVTIEAVKQNKKLEARLACVSGNLAYCH